MFNSSRRSRGRRASGGGVCATLVVGLTMALAPSAAAETLSETLAKAYSTNPDLAAAQSRLRQVDEQLSAANANWRPSVAITTEAEDLSETGKYPGTRYNNTYGLASAKIEAVQPIFSSGRFGAIRGVAQAQIHAERAQLRLTEQRVLLDTIKAFADVAVSERTFDLIRQDVTVLQDVLKQTSDRAQHHHATETDVEQTTAALDAARAECLSRQAKLFQSWRAYQQLAGAAPAIVAPTPDSGVNACLDTRGERRRSTIVLPDTFPNVPPSIEDVEQAALHGAPEIEFAQAKQEEARHAADAAYAELLPRAQLTAKLRTDENDANGPHSTTQDASINAEIHIPIFNGGSEWSAIRAAREHGGETRLLAESSARQSTRNAASAWFELTSVQAVKLVNKMQARAQQAAFAGMKAEIGKPKFNRSTSDLLNQEHAVLASQIALAQSDRDEAVAIYSLLAAIGGLNAVDLQLPVTVYNVDANLKKQSGRWLGDSLSGE